MTAGAAAANIPHGGSIVLEHVDSKETLKVDRIRTVFRFNKDMLGMPNPVRIDASKSFI